MGKQVFFELVLPVKPLVTQATVKRAFVHHAVLDQVGSCSEPLITECTGIGSVSKVEVLVLHQDVFVAETPLADVALVRFLPNMG